MQLGAVQPGTTHNGTTSQRPDLLPARLLANGMRAETLWPGGLQTCVSSPGWRASPRSGRPLLKIVWGLPPVEDCVILFLELGTATSGHGMLLRWTLLTTQLLSPLVPKCCDMWLKPGVGSDLSQNGYLSLYRAGGPGQVKSTTISTNKRATLRTLTTKLRVVPTVGPAMQAGKTSHIVPRLWLRSLSPLLGSLAAPDSPFGSRRGCLHCSPAPPL